MLRLPADMWPAVLPQIAPLKRSGLSLDPPFDVQVVVVMGKIVPFGSRLVGCGRRRGFGLVRRGWWGQFRRPSSAAAGEFGQAEAEVPAWVVLVSACVGFR